MPNVISDGDTKIIAGIVNCIVGTVTSTPGKSAAIAFLHEVDVPDKTKAVIRINSMFFMSFI